MIGFGSTETAYEQREMTCFREFLHQCIDADGYVSEEIEEEVKAWVEARSKRERDKVASYNKSDQYPDRYSSYYVDVAFNANSVFASFKFTHIHRKSPLSTDGWAAIYPKRLFHFSVVEDSA